MLTIINDVVTTLTTKEKKTLSKMNILLEKLLDGVFRSSVSSSSNYLKWRWDTLANLLLFVWSTSVNLGLKNLLSNSYLDFHLLQHLLDL